MTLSGGQLRHPAFYIRVRSYAPPKLFTHPAQIRNNSDHALKLVVILTVVYIRRTTSGKSLHTFTPQKCDPSVQIGVEMPARSTHGGPM